MSKLKQKGSCRDCGCTPCEVNPRCNECCRCLPKWLCFRLTPVIGSDFPVCYDGIGRFLPWSCNHNAYQTQLFDDITSAQFCFSSLTTTDVTIAVGEFLGECTYALLQLPGLGTYWVESEGVWSPAAEEDEGAVWKDSVPDDEDGDFRVPVAVECRTMAATWLVEDEEGNEFTVTTEIAPETVANPLDDCDGCGGCRCLPQQIQVDYVSPEGYYGIAFPTFDPLIPGYEAEIVYYYPQVAVGEDAPTITLTVERGGDGECVLVPTGTSMWDETTMSLVGICPYPFQVFWGEDYSEQFSVQAFGCIPPVRPCFACPDMHLPLAWMVLMEVDDPCNDNCASIDGAIMFPDPEGLGELSWCEFGSHDIFLCGSLDESGELVREQTTIGASIASGGMLFGIGAPSINPVTYRKDNTGQPCNAIHVLTRDEPEEDCYGCDPNITNHENCCCPWPVTITLVPIFEL